MRIYCDVTYKRIPILFVCDKFTNGVGNTVWIMGARKKEIEELGIEVICCRRITLVDWAYQVFKREFEGYLRTYGYPKLILKYGA